MWILVGGSLVLIVLRDIFHTLFHPSGLGSVTKAVFRMVFRGTRPLWARGHGPELAGPTALVVVIAAWTGGILLGFALIYLPWLDEFSLPSGQSPAHNIGTALYLSTVALSTLGLGDIVPETGPPRALFVLEALLGFLLLTAAISWVLQLYPALSRRRHFSRSLNALHSTNYHRLLRGSARSSDVILIDSLRAHASTATVDLQQYGESYYFREATRSDALAATLPYATVVAASARDQRNDETCRAAGERLSLELDQLATQLSHHLSLRDLDGDVYTNYARDHGHPTILDEPLADRPVQPPET